MLKINEIIEAIESGIDVAKQDYYDWIANFFPEYRRYLKSPSRSEVLSAFSDTIKKILPEKIKELKKRQREFENKLKRLPPPRDEYEFVARRAILNFVIEEYDKKIRELYSFLKPRKVKKEREKEKITAFDIERAKEYPIVTLAEELGFSPKKVGQNYFIKCPFHEETHPSCCLNPDKNIFYCFGCQKGGNVITFYMEITGKTFKEAVEDLAFDKF